RRREAFADGIALAFAILLQDLDVPFLLVGIADALALFKGTVAGITFDEKDFLARREFRHPQDRALDIAALVAAGNDNADREFAVRELPDRTPDQISAQAQFPDPGERRDETVDEGPEPEPSSRQQLPLLSADHLEIG